MKAMPAKLPRLPDGCGKELGSGFEAFLQQAPVGWLVKAMLGERDQAVAAYRAKPRGRARPSGVPSRLRLSYGLPWPGIPFRARDNRAARLATAGRWQGLDCRSRAGVRTDRAERVAGQLPTART